jgi:glycosyltransferase involved in cell wall biosynthesis
MSPLVSLVVPAYNNADFIASTVDSLLAQDYPNLEIIVADHASSDQTREILAGYDDPRLTVVDTPAGGGAARNWNRVSQLSTGDYLKLVCGDDLIDPSCVSAQVAALEANPSAVLAASPRKLIDARGDVFVKSHGLSGLEGLHPGPQAVRAVVRSGANPFGEPAVVMFRRSALEKAGWWSAEKSYYIDLDAYVRVLQYGDFVGTPDPLASFRVSASQWSVRLMREQHEHAKEFHAEQHVRFPEAISQRDVRFGDFNAYVAAWKRRLAYLVLGSRMRPADEA